MAQAALEEPITRKDLPFRLKVLSLERALKIVPRFDELAVAGGESLAGGGAPFNHFEERFDSRVLSICCRNS